MSIRALAALDKAVTQALAGLCFVLLLAICIPHSAYATPHFSDKTPGGLPRTVNYTSYDNNGNLLTLSENGANGITRTYDGLNRVTSYTFGANTAALSNQAGATHSEPPSASEPLCPSSAMRSA
jgi:YD repeat-containing protein